MKHWLIAALLAFPLASAQAQEQIEWKQTLNIPKGQNIARDRADILGIEFGDTYAEAKTKLEALYAETAPKDTPKPAPQSGNSFIMSPGQAFAEFSDATAPKRPPVVETTSRFQITLPGLSTMYMAAYVSMLTMERKLPGSGPQPIEERIEVLLSAPSSGQQVIGISRSLVYPQADQPRMTEVLEQVRQKYHAEPSPQKYSIKTFSFPFDDGKPVPPAKSTDCAAAFTYSDTLDSVRQINEGGKCDVVLSVSFETGISSDYASSLAFRFGDNERIKASRIADYAYLETYISDLQNRTRGKVPKL